MTPQVNSIIEDIQHYTGKINNMLKNSCQTAMALVDGVKDRTKTYTQCRSRGYEFGHSADAAMNLQECADMNVDAVAGGDQDKKDELEGNRNLTWEVVKERYATTSTSQEMVVWANLIGMILVKNHKVAPQEPLDYDRMICGLDDCSVFSNSPPASQLDVMECVEFTTYTKCLNVANKTVPYKSVSEKIYDYFYQVYRDIKLGNTGVSYSPPFKMGEYGKQLSRLSYALAKYRTQFSNDDAKAALSMYARLAAAHIVQSNFFELVDEIGETTLSLPESEVEVIEKVIRNRKDSLAVIVNKVDKTFEDNKKADTFRKLLTVDERMHRNLLQMRASMVTAGLGLGPGRR